jgi:hypothetical protein
VSCLVQSVLAQIKTFVDDDKSRTPVGKVKEAPIPAPVRRYPIEDLDVVLTDRDRKVSLSNMDLSQHLFTNHTGGPVGDSTTV